MQNYFNQLSDEDKKAQLGRCRFMQREEFSHKIQPLLGKKIVIIGCGAQGLNQGLNIRDSGLDVAFALRQSAIDEKRLSFQRATENNFKVGTYAELIPNADLVINLTPDKQHANVIADILPLMKKGATLGYSHGLNIVEQGEKIREDITVVMVAPKCPGTEVREEYKRGFGVPTLLAVHKENDPKGEGLAIAKAWVVATGGDRAGVLESSFVAEVKSDLMGEQTILCGMLQAGSLACYDYLLKQGKSPAFTGKLIQYGWEVLTEPLKEGGISLMMAQFSPAYQQRICQLADNIKQVFTPLFEKHMHDILSGEFSKAMMQDWKNGDKDLLQWRQATAETAFENAPLGDDIALSKQDYFDNGLLMAAMIKAGVELAFEVMVKNGIYPESAYYESLHELPLIANLVARKRLYEMNVVISDTAEYGNYLFANQAVGLFEREIIPLLQQGDLGTVYQGEMEPTATAQYAEQIAAHPIEQVGRTLRDYMKQTKQAVQH